MISFQLYVSTSSSEKRSNVMPPPGINGLAGVIDGKSIPASCNKHKEVVVVVDLEQYALHMNMPNALRD